MRREWVRWTWTCVGVAGKGSFPPLTCQGGKQRAEVFGGGERAVVFKVVEKRVEGRRHSSPAGSLV